MERRPSSLARRVVVTVTAITAGTTAIAAVGAWLATREVLVADLDRDLHRHAERLERMVRSAPPGAWVRNEPPRPPREGRPMLQIARCDPWAVVHSTSEVPEGSVLFGPDDRGTGMVVLADGRAARRLVLDLDRAPPFVSASAAGAAPVRAVVAVDLEPAQAELDRLALVLAVLWGAATGLALAAGLWLAPATIRPLRRLADAIGGIGPDRLDGRIAAGTGPAEAAAVVERLNDLLARLGAAFARERGTLQAMAHELRTPVAVLRSDIEFRLLAGPGADERQRLQRHLAEVDRMQRLVQDLLLLARIEAGAEAMPAAAADVSALVAEVVDRERPRAATAGLGVKVETTPGLTATTSPGHLRIAVAALVGNAIDHASAGPIRIAIAHAAHGIAIRVENPCASGIVPERVGEPFYRADPARGAGHSGLGAALARRIAAALGGRVGFSVADGRFCALLTIP
ncbi:MAG: Sensor kinase CusS [Planctomycetota bacterium]|jgi:signal transduction histidine kinase